MPELTSETFGSDATQRNAHDAADASGSAFLRIPSALGLGRASAPPCSGSITATSIPFATSFSYCSFERYFVQSW